MRYTYRHECDSIPMKKGLTYKKAKEEAIKLTRKTKKEYGFVFDPEKKNEPDIKEIFRGTDKNVLFCIEDMKGTFHTHPYDVKRDKEELLGFSKMDIFANLGTYMIVAEIPSNGEEPTFIHMDLRFKNDMREQIMNYLSLIEREEEGNFTNDDVPAFYDCIY